MLYHVDMSSAANRPLTAKQQAFVDQYLVDRNATRAYLEVYGGQVASAGRSGPRLLKDVRIEAEIVRRTTIVSERANVTVAYVLDNLTEIVERCMERAPVMVRDPLDGRKMVQKQDDEGRDVWQFDARGANTALTTLAKHLGMLKDRIELSGDLATLLTKARGAQ